MRRVGLHVLTIVAKATYQLMPGVSPLAEQQEPVNESDNHWNDDPTRSVYAPSDMVPFKPRPDVVLVGYAFAPQQTPVKCLVTRLVVGKLEKRIEVWTDRTIGADGTLHEAPPFVKVPLRYERAAFAPDNPVGIRPEPRMDKGGSVAVPNLQPPALNATSLHGRIPPLGYGPLAPSWPIRARRLPPPTSTLPNDWHKSPMPEGLDPGYFNCAPLDQQVESLGPKERIILENLHSQHARLETSLPGVTPRAYIERSSVTEELAMTADTLWIDTDRGIATLTWRAQVRLDKLDVPGRVVITTRQPHAPQARASRPGNIDGSVIVDLESDVQVVVADASASLGRDVNTATIDEAILGTVLPPNHRAKQTMPFVAGPPEPVVPIESKSPLLPRIAPEHSNIGGTMLVPVGVVRPATLPFGQENPPAPAFEPVVAQPAFVPPLMTPPVVEATPAITMGQAAVLAARPSAPGPVAMVDAPAPPLVASVSTSDPMLDRTSGAPQLGSVAALRNAGLVPGMPPQSATAASNSAADPWFGGVALDSPVPPLRSRIPVEVLWFDPTFLAAIRNDAAMRAILTERDKFAGSKKTDKKQTPAKPVPPELDSKDREDINALLTLGEPSGVEILSMALDDAVDERGVFRPPLLLLRGELAFPFDEVETLKATISAVTPLAAGDKKLKETIDAVGELLRTPWLQSAGSVTERLTNQVKEAFGTGNRLLPSGYLETHTERILLEQRHYQKRVVLGQPWIRALLGSPNTSTRVPTYIPYSLARELPMYQRFNVRMIAEVRAQLDQYETHSTALRVVALGRVLGSSTRR